MRLLNQKGAAQFILLLVLVAGFVSLLYLIQKPTSFYPRAEVSDIYFVDEAGNPIIVTFTPTVKVKVNSPIWSSKATPTLNPAEDTDSDGWTNKTEDFLGTDPYDNCSDDTLDAAWPPDFDNNRRIDREDRQMLQDYLKGGKKALQYNKRYDLSVDGKIDKDDFDMLQRHQGSICNDSIILPVPTSTTVSTTHVVFAEDPQFASNQHKYQFSQEPLTYTFSDANPGIKNLYAKYLSSDSREQQANPFPVSIELKLETVTEEPPIPTPTPPEQTIYQN